MGFFSSIFSLNNARELTKIGDGVANVTNFLDGYEEDNELETLFVSAYICRVAIMDVVERNNFPVTYSLYTQLRGHRQKITINEAYLLTVSRLMSKANQRGVSNEVQQILNMQGLFNEIDKLVPYELKKIFI